MKSNIKFDKIKNKGERIKKRVKKRKNNLEENLKKKKGKSFWYKVLIFITGAAILCFLMLIIFALYIIIKAPKFDEEELYNKESSIIYDQDGEVIATLGMNVGNDVVETRTSLSYEEMPEVLIDALVATEDSRFFQHNGVDLARFLKASIGQVLGNSDAGGASTLTMQVSKNTLTSSESSGIAGILRKFTDIYLSIFEIEKRYTKYDILEMYLNSGYLGNQSYGIEQASITYFGKSASELNLSEAAMLVGLFQAPGAYDPFVYPEKAEKRRNTVLDLMVRHGYISEEVANEAKKLTVESMIISASTSSNVYQGYIDTVVEEVIDKYGVDPYVVPIEIYTYMSKEKQDALNDFYSGKTGYTFKDEYIQLGVVVLDNSNGAMIAVGSGRNITGSRGWNYATMISRHPGSTIKPLLDYGPAIEYLNWSTYSPLFDESTVSYTNGGVMNNWNYSNSGLVTMQYALTNSINTTALETFRATTNEQKWEFITSLGITPGNSNGVIYESSSIGAFDGVSPKQLAGAYSAFATGGYYTEPHTIEKIKYIEDGEEEKVTYSRTRVMKETTAYLITYILQNVTPSSGKISGTTIATKTGTSSYETSALSALGLSGNIVQDQWIGSYNPDYTFAFWYGYDELTKDHYNYMSAANAQRSQIFGYLSKAIYETGSTFKVPSGLTKVEVELETIPARLASEYTPSNLRQTHYFITGTEPTETSTRFSKLEDPKNVEIIESGSTIKLSWDAVKTPNAIDSDYLQTYFNTNYGVYAEKYYNNRLTYNANNIGDFGYDIYYQSGSNLTFVAHTTDTSYTLTYKGGYDSVVVKSAYSIFKDNASDGVVKTITGSNTSISIEVLGVQLKDSLGVNLTLSIGDTVPDIGLDTIKFLVNGTDMTSTISSSDMNYTIRDCTGTCKNVESIDTSKKGTYQVVYTVNYLGTTYKNTRSITVK